MSVTNILESVRVLGSVVESSYRVVAGSGRYEIHGKSIRQAVLMGSGVKVLRNRLAR